jgi:hypothetical protein
MAPAEIIVQVTFEPMDTNAQQNLSNYIFPLTYAQRINLSHDLSQVHEVPVNAMMHNHHYQFKTIQ